MSVIEKNVETKERLINRIKEISGNHLEENASEILQSIEDYCALILESTMKDNE